MFKYTVFFILIQLLRTQAVYNEWDYAVAAMNKILFYDSDWNLVNEEAHQFDSITAIAFNEIGNEIFFNGRDRNNGSIHLLKQPNIKGSRSLIDTIVARTDGDEVTGIAFDPLSQTLFWSDETQRKISSLVLNGSDNKPVDLIRFEDPLQKPFGLSLDMCRRKLYWSQSDDRNLFSINKMSLDGSDREKIIKDIESTYGIAVDQFSARIFITVRYESTKYTVESFKLDGSDKQVLVSAYDRKPHGLTVTEDSVVWLETASRAAYKVPKEPKGDGSTHDPEFVTLFTERSYEIVSKVGLYHKYKSVKECAQVMEQIEKGLISSSKIPDGKRSLERNNSILCLDNGFVKGNAECQCNPGYTGRRCQTYECHNFCVSGTCEINNGFPKCKCPPGYTGKRCETNVCHNFCLNGGVCSTSSEEKPVCQCLDGFKGSRCELNSTETCQAPCILPHDVTQNECSSVCQDVAKMIATTTVAPNDEHLKECPSSWNKSIIIVVVGAVVCLGFVYLIVQAVRRFYKPERPRIRKTFVVKQHTNSNTPLTCRPIATEECQITIENCCNMNICETPCFDPKLLQENMSNGTKASAKSKKEDKQVLLPDLD